MAEDFDKAMLNLRSTEIFKEWIKKMTPFLDEIQAYSKDGKIVKIKKVFDLEEQLANLNARDIWTEVKVMLEISQQNPGILVQVLATDTSQLL